MVKLLDIKEHNLSSLVHLKQPEDVAEIQSFGEEKDYKKLLEDKIKEKKLSLELDEKEIRGRSRENLQKKRNWMGELIKPISEIKDILEKTALIEIKLIYRRGNVALNDLKNIIIKSIDYDESQLVKSGFKLDIDFCPRSHALNNKRDCYLVQLLGHTFEQEGLQKYYSRDSLM